MWGARGPSLDNLQELAEQQQEQRSAQHFGFRVIPIHMLHTRKGLRQGVLFSQAVLIKLALQKQVLIHLTRTLRRVLL